MVCSSQILLPFELVSIPAAWTVSPLSPYQLIDTKALQLKDYLWPVCLDAGLLAEGVLHDGVQGHQGDMFKDLRQEFWMMCSSHLFCGGRGILTEHYLASGPQLTKLSCLSRHLFGILHFPEQSHYSILRLWSRCFYSENYILRSFDYVIKQVPS